jgi:hypothetical protein
LDHSLQIGSKGPNGVQVIWEDGERALCRIQSPEYACLTSVLAVVPLAEHPSPASLDRLSHEFGLREELDAGWAVRPLKLEHDRGRTKLVFEDPGGEPLANLLGRPLEISCGLQSARPPLSARFINPAFSIKTSSQQTLWWAARTDGCDLPGSVSHRGCLASDRRRSLPTPSPALSPTWRLSKPVG